MLVLVLEMAGCPHTSSLNMVKCCIKLALWMLEDAMSAWSERLKSGDLLMRENCNIAHFYQEIYLDFLLMKLKTIMMHTKFFAYLFFTSLDFLCLNF